MKKMITVMLLLLSLTSCSTTVVTPKEMSEIARQSLQHDPGLSRYAVPWHYVGSDEQFDYVLFSGVIGEKEIYRVLKGQLNLPTSFRRTRNESAWIPLSADGSLVPIPLFRFPLFPISAFQFCKPEPPPMQQD